MLTFLPRAFGLTATPATKPSFTLGPRTQPRGDVTLGDRYAELSAQIVRADAMLASGELTPSDHKYLVEKILATYYAR